MLKPIGINPQPAESNTDISQDRLKKACSEFESIFINYMLKSMGESLVEGERNSNNEKSIIRSMFNENLALGIAKGGGIGLGKILFDSLKS